MYLVGIFVATLYSVAQAVETQPSQDHGKDTKESQQDASKSSLSSSSSSSSSSMFPPQPPVRMMDYCFLGSIPSATCRFKCHIKGQEAYCDQDQAKCLCRDYSEEEESSQTDENGFNPFQMPQQPHPTTAPFVPHFQIHMQPVSAPDSSSSAPSKAVSTQTEEEPDEKKHHVTFYIFDLDKIFGHENKTESGEATKPAPEGTTATPEAWSLQHLLAVLIVVLLLVLISLELYACYKKKRSKSSDMETIFKSIPVPNKA